ncbi:FAD-dependent oxidoreductase [Isosphaeraceae bacterium EP7]
MRPKLVIIGNGLATGRLLDGLMARGGVEAFDIHVYGEEPHGLYNRILIGRLLGGGTVDEITLKPVDWYAENGITFHCGVLIDRLDTVAKVAITSDGTIQPYDRAVFATGSRAFIPPLVGLLGEDGRPKAGVLVFRTLDDGHRIRDRARAGQHAVVLGGGLLGLEAAKSLSDLGMQVSVIQRSDTLMDQQVDEVGGLFLRKSIEQLGIGVIPGVKEIGIVGSEQVEGVTLGDGRTLTANLLVLACGIRPRIDSAAASGLTLGRGILVDDHLGTSARGVYAVGECAEHDGQVYGIVEPIWQQCDVLADLITGADPGARYLGSKPYTRLKVAGVGVASMGLVRPSEEDDEVIQIIEERSGTYRKLIIRHDRLVGAVLIGETGASPDLARWLDRGDPLPANRIDVLCSGGSYSSAPDPEVCNCHHVRESTIVASIRGGKTTVGQVSDSTRAGTGCGSCRVQITRLLGTHAPTDAALA